MMRVIRIKIIFINVCTRTVHTTANNQCFLYLEKILDITDISALEIEFFEDQLKRQEIPLGNE